MRDVAELMDTVDELLDRNQGKVGTISELARRMAELEPRQNAESWRKSLRRWRTANAKETDIALIARAFGVSRDALPAPHARPVLADIERRLAALEATVGLVDESTTVGNLLEELVEKLADVTERLRDLEAQSGHGGAAGAGSP
jgi:DNA repair exonuclease SbcCD ATPase subunit